MVTLAWIIILLFLEQFNSVVSQSCVSPTSKCDCFLEDTRKIINCRYKNLTSIPIFTDTGQVYDEIRFTSSDEPVTCQSWSRCNRITRIDANAFRNLQVQSIDLRNNQITLVDPEAFSSLVPTFKSILIEGDGTNTPPYQALAVLSTHLTALHLENYGTKVLQIPIVLPFPNLESLTLKNWRRLDSINADVFNIMKNLMELRLVKMPSLVMLPVPAIQKFLRLKTIEIMDTGIKTIFGDTFAPMSMLVEINIRNNVYLRSIDQRAFVGVEDTVLYLDLSNNHLDNIDFFFNGNWAALSRLNVGYNSNLRTLPTGILRNTPALRYLECQHIGLTQINESMFIGLSKLHTLDLAYNQITNISTGTFQTSPSLVELRLNDQQTNHQLVNFQNNTFLGVQSSLEILNLKHNHFNLSMFWKDLVGLQNLKQLDLSNTGVENIPNKAFRGNTKLNTLVLSDNNITLLKQDTFYGPRNTLRLINLQRNGIKTIDDCVFSDFPTKPTLVLFGNPLVCDCDLVWLYDWFKTQGNQGRISADIGPCVSPPSLSNKYLHEITRNNICPRGVSVNTCPDLYMTVTSSSTTSTLLTTTKTTTNSPLPTFELVIVNVLRDNFEVSWLITDKTHLTELKLELISNVPTQITYLGPDQSTYTFYQLTPDTYYTVCLILKINNEFRDFDANCKQVKTLHPDAVNGTAIVRPGSGGIIG